MKDLLRWAQGIVLVGGGPGLLFIAFIDSSFLSMPEVVDLLVVWLVTRHESLVLYYVAMATVGSVAGCLVLFWLARKGGEAFLRKRLHERHLDRGTAVFQRWGVLAVLVSSLLPPPTPFKLFVLSAGVAGLSTTRFTLAVGVGRGLRYSVEGLLAYWYGDMAISYIQAHAAEAGIATAVALLLAALAYVLWIRARRRNPGRV